MANAVSKTCADRTFVGTVRVLQPRIAKLRDPHAEIMAMVWGPRFDRAHAVDLLMQDKAADADMLICVTAAADQFDSLQPERQRRLRRWIMAHRGRSGPLAQAVDNIEHAANSSN